ncbi:MAG: GGDEF domain-containing protein, partial [Vogesella sp.]|uniref:GGDEF domain-containing protein n=1 Tax=Vogesella sp. TaxID=1904252 RepID=UPI003F413399
MHSPTLVAIAAILMVLMTFMLLAAWRLNPHIPGLKGWTLAFGCGLLVCLNLLLRDSGHEWLMVIMTQLSSFLLAWLNLAAARRYLGRRALPVLAGVAGAVSVLACALYFTLLEVNQGARFLLQSTTAGLLFLMAARQMATGGVREYPARYLFAAISGSHGLFLLLRPWLFRLGEHGMFDRHGTLVVSHLAVVESIIAVVMLGFSVVMLANEQVTQALKHMADRDPLTGTYNRRAFMNMLEKATHYSSRLGFPVSVLLIDLDHFKRINDTWGHQRGDDALRHVVGVAHDCLREGDILGRLGGEEFAIALPNANQHEAEQIASRLRQAIAAQPLQYAGALLPLTT